MKTTLQLQALRVTLRGVPAPAAAAAVRDLGPAIARRLAAGPAAPSPRLAAGSPGPAVREAVAARVAAALRPHLRPPA